MKDLIFLDSVLKMPLMHLPVRTVAIKISDAVILISPGSKTKAEQLKALGHVTDIVAPNLFHCAGVQKAAALFPQARIWGVVGAKEKRPDIKWTHELSDENWPYREKLAAISIRGMPKINETVFFHRESGSLIVADLCFNMTDVTGFGPWLILSLFGTYRRLGVSRFFLRFLKDRAAMEASLRRVLAFDFDRIIVSHGKVVSAGGKQLLRHALEQRGFELGFEDIRDHKSH